jgi:tetratricopeptide (TPR) repeat protein
MAGGSGMKKLSFLVICLAALTACSTSKQGLVSKGNKLFNAGKYADAEIAYRKAIQKDPKYGEAYYRLGLLELKMQHGSEAQKALLNAVQFLPQSIEAKEQLGSLMLEYYMVDPQRSQSYYNVVKQMSDELLAKNPSSFEGLREKAYLALSDGKADQAIALFRKALQVNPSDPTVTLALAQNLARQGQSQEAERLAVGFVSSHKADGEMYDFLYELYSSQKRPADAENILKAKVSNNPGVPAYRIDLATHYFLTRKSPEMQSTLQALLNDSKTFPNGRMRVGDFYMKKHAYAEAIHYYEEGARLSKGTERTDYLKRTVNALLADGKTEVASHLVAEIVKDNPDDQEAHLVQANILLKTKNPENIARAEHEFQDLSKEKADDASVWLGLANAEALKGNLDAARQQYLAALNKRKDLLPPRYALAEIGLVQNDPNLTLQQTEEILKKNPADSRARLLHAQALARAGSVAMARSEFSQLSKSFPGAVQPQLELGLLAIKDKKYSDAAQTFSKLRSTGDQRAFAGEAMAYSSQNQYNKALEILNEGLKKYPSSVLLMGNLASTAALAGNYDLAIAECQKLLAVQPNSVSHRLLLGDAYASKGQNAEALAAYREAYKLSPKDLTTGVSLGRALVAAGQTDEARAQFQSVLAAHPDDPTVLNEMAFFIA